MASPLCVLLLPRTLEAFILRDQAEDLLRAPGVVAVEPGRVPYGAWARLPRAPGVRLAGVVAARILQRLDGSFDRRDLLPTKWTLSQGRMRTRLRGVTKVTR